MPHPALSAFVRFSFLYAFLYAGFGGQSPFLPALFQAHGLVADEIGLIVALGTLIRMVSGFLVNRIADRFDAARFALAFCAAGSAAVALFYLPARGFWTLLAVAMLQAVLLAPLTTLADALALGAAAPPRDAGARAFEYGWVRGTGSAAFIAGLVLSGQAVAALGLDVIVWLNVALLAGAAATALAVATPPKAVRGPSPIPHRVWDLLRLERFRQIVLVAALVLGSHAMHDSFAVIRWQAAGMSSGTAGLIWSESVSAEVVVFFLVGPSLVDRLGPSRALALSAAAGTLRWAVMALTAAPAAMALIEPLHGLTFALLHLACMRVIAHIVPPELAATAQAIYGTVAVGLATAALTYASGVLYGRVGASGFWFMAVMCAAALPIALWSGVAKNPDQQA